MEDVCRGYDDVQPGNGGTDSRPLNRRQMISYMDSRYFSVIRSRVVSMRRSILGAYCH